MEAINKIDHFDYVNCIRWLDTIIQSQESKYDFPAEELCKFLDEFCLVFKRMGKLLSMAFSDIDDKVKIMRERNENYRSECYGMLFAIVKKEMALNVANLNGQNNKKFTNNPQYQDYDSFSRNLLRMMWLQNFLSVMFGELLKDRKQNPSKIFQKAYDFAFSKNHTFMVKTGASIAMSSAPSRDKIKEYIVGKNSSDDQFYLVMSQLHERIVKVNDYQWKFFEANKLTSLP